MQALADLTRCQLLSPLSHQRLIRPALAAANLPASLSRSGQTQATSLKAIASSQCELCLLQPNWLRWNVTRQP